MSTTDCEKDDFLRPRFRKLRAYAFDPSLSIQLSTNLINNIVYKVAWEDKLMPGPVGEYIEVVDYDPSSGCFYRPVDLNDRFLLAQDGLDPSESNPQFHQQMVYAVAMTTIKNFELALGRKIMWSQYRNHQGVFSQYVPRLRIYPHAIREANAYYSPQKKAVLFGYFNATPDNPSLLMPGCTVYTCLSHDIIAHEVTHALLDGMHRRYIEATHTDSLAFHEAFADIVALFQHFTFPEVLKDQIAKTGGDLRAQNLLGELAQEFGKAIGHYGSLRDAIGKYNEEKEIWEPHKPRPEDYQKEKEPHARGAILVATIFDAFINLYKKRIADLVRIATGGTGILPPGSLHPDLVNRMANEASKTANHILKMCIRALDYCPPLDINFGDYLRALITSDYDLVSDDPLGYRIAIIEAFQNRGIFPDNVKNMSVESLLCKVEEDSTPFESRFAKLIEFFRRFKEKISYITNREEIYELTKVFIAGGDIGQVKNNKKNAAAHTRENIQGLHERLNTKFLGEEDANEFANLTGLILDDTQLDDLGIARSKKPRTNGMPMLEVHNLKLASRSGPNGSTVNQIIVTLTQKRGVVGVRDEWGNPRILGFFKPENPMAGWSRRIAPEKPGGRHTYKHEPYKPPESGSKEDGSEKVLPEGWFIFRGGSTLIFDLDYADDRNELKLLYVIKKDIKDEERMKRQFDMLFNQEDFSLNATYFGTPFGNLEAEPFALIHKVL
jgi:hypothetical protein